MPQQGPSKFTSNSKTLTGVLLVAVMVVFVFLMARITIPYFSFRYDIGFLLTKQNVIHLSIWKQAFYIHIATGTFVLLLGTFQFIKPLINRRPQLHRNLGKIYIALILIFTAPSGFVMALYANGGIVAQISFTITALLWWLFTFLAYKNARERNFTQHKANMYRSYALTLTAISLRTYVLILPHFIHLHSTEMYCLVAWLSWIPNMAIAEYLIRRKKLSGIFLIDRI